MSAMTDNIKILLIDDNEADYILTRNHLTSQKDYKFELQWKNTFDTALTFIIENNADFDICLMDYNIGAQNGLELAKKVREMGFRNPIIMYSGMQEQYIRNIHETENVIEGFLSKTDLTGDSIVRQMEDAMRNKVEEFEKWSSENASEQPEETLGPFSTADMSENVALAILENFPEPVMALDASGKVTMVNRVFAELMCLQPSEILNSNATLFMDCTFEEFKSLSKSSGGGRLKTKIKLNNDNGKRFIKWNVYDVKGNDPEVRYVAKGTLGSRSKRKKSALASALSLPFKWVPTPGYYKANDMYFRKDSFK